MRHSPVVLKSAEVDQVLAEYRELFIEMVRKTQNTLTAVASLVVPAER